MGNRLERDALEGKGAVVTGANSGIGACITQKLLAYGMTVIGIDTETDNLDKMKEDEKVAKFLHIIEADITDEEEVLDAFQWITDNVENVDVLINSAEYIEKSSILDGDLKQWQKMANVNILGLCTCTTEMIRTMKDQKIDLGLIVNLSSISSEQVATESSYHFYSATKHVVRYITENLRKEIEYNDQPIKITSITIGPNEFFAKDGYENDWFDVHGTLELSDISSAIDYVIHTPSHTQVRDLHIIPTEMKK